MSDDDQAVPEPLALSQIAEFQAGLLDDRQAAAVRRRARTDLVVARQLGALDRVRRDVAALGADPASAPDVPAEVTARIGAALRGLPSGADATAAPRRSRSARRRPGR